MDEARAQVHVRLYQGGVAAVLELVDLPRLDHEDIPRPRLELDAVHLVAPSTFPDELDLIVGMPMRARPLPREGIEQEDGDVDVPLVGADELVRTADEGERLLADAVHGRVLQGGRRRVRGGGGGYPRDQGGGDPRVQELRGHPPGTGGRAPEPALHP